MTAHGSTRRRAFEVACALAAVGKRPTIAAVREGPGGTGSQQAIGAGIDDWLDEAARRFQIPGIPGALRAHMIAVWDQACRPAGEQWEGARTALEAQVAGVGTQLTAVTDERDVARTEVERLPPAFNEKGTALRDIQDALDLADSTLVARTEALAEATEAMAQARVQIQDQARQGGQARSSAVAGTSRTAVAG